MPVYMRKRQDSLSLSQFSEPSPDIDGDFVLDPDKHREPLPQPYRFIDKVLDGLLERTFQEMFSHEEERLHEQTRYKPPVVPTELCRVVPDVRASEIRQICASADTDQRFAFCALDGQLLALDAVTMATLGAFSAPGLDVVHLETAELRQGLHLLATLDDLGLARLFLWDAAASAFHLARLVNDDEAGDKKLNCLAVRLSADGEYLALTLQNASTHAVALEVFRIPRDAWSKEVEQQATKPAAAAAAAAEGSSSVDGEQQQQDEAATTAGNASGTEEAARVPVLKLSPMSPVLRVKQPPPSASGCGSAASGAAAPNLKAVDATGDAVGSGLAHLLTKSHLQLREAHFRRLHDAELRCLDAEATSETGGMSLPSVLFLKPGKNLGTDQTSDKDLFVSVAVSWSADYKVFIYSLLKVGKDLEFRPDTVWTCASPVTCLAASPCTSLVAVGLESGNLLVQDTRLGLTRHVITVDSDRPQPIVRVFFLNPAVATAEAEGSQQVYKSVQPVRAAIFAADLTPYLADVGPDAAPTARRLATSARHAYEAPQLVEYPRSHPSLLVRASRSGALVLHDVRLQQEILQFALPPPHQLPRPWQPGSWALAARGRSLFLRGRDDDSGEERLFFYNLKILIPMAPYWKLQAPEAPCYAHCPVGQRADAYLQHRNATHAERQKNLADMWSNLFDSLKEVEMAKAAAASSDTPRSVKTLRTSLSSFSDDSKDARLKEFLQRDSVPVA